MYISTIDFKHNYNKLYRDDFTTIRGKSWFYRLKEKQKIIITMNKEFFCHAEVQAKTIFKIANIGFEILKADAAYPGFRIRNRQDFIDLINSFRKSWMPQANLYSQVTVIYLHKIHDLSYQKEKLALKQPKHMKQTSLLEQMEEVLK